MHVEGVGVTQARKLSEAETMVRDLIVRRDGATAGAIELVWHLDLGKELTAEVDAARSAVPAILRAKSSLKR